MDENLLIHLEIKKSDIPDIYHLYANENKYIGIANIPTLKCSKMVKKLLLENANNIVECKYNKHFSKWEPIKSIEGHKTDIDDVKSYLQLFN